MHVAAQDICRWTQYGSDLVFSFCYGLST